MPKYRIDFSELEGRESEKVEELKKFLKDRFGVKVEKSDGELVMSVKKTTSKTHLRGVLRKFLHKMKLRDEFRVIAKERDSFLIKERK